MDQENQVLEEKPTTPAEEINKEDSNVETTETVENSTNEDSNGASNGASKEAPDEKPRKRGVPPSERIRQLAGQKNQYKAELEEANKKIAEFEKTQIITKPRKDSFDDEDEYRKQKDKYNEQRDQRLRSEGVDDYKLEQQAKNEEASIQKVYSNYDSKRAEAIDKYKDYTDSEELVTRILREFKVPGLGTMILSSEDPHAMMNHLGNDVGELDDLADKFLSDPNGVARTLGKLEAKLVKKPAAKAKIPEPLPKAGGGAGKVNKDLTEMSQAEYNRYKNFGKR